jgi:hypothetical protein
MLAILSAQNLLSSTLLSKYLKIKIYRTIILHVDLYGWETWPLILKKERMLRLSENRVLRRIFEYKWNEITGGGENYIMRSFMIRTAHQILFE